MARFEEARERIKRGELPLAITPNGRIYAVPGGGQRFVPNEPVSR